MLSLTLLSEGWTSRPVTFKLPCTDRASSGLSVFIPTRPWNNSILQLSTKTLGCKGRVRAVSYQSSLVQSKKWALGALLTLMIRLPIRLTETKLTVCGFQIELQFGNVGFEENRKPEYPEKNLSEKTNNKVSPHMTPGHGIKLRPHWWKASALTTTPPPLP